MESFGWTGVILVFWFSQRSAFGDREVLVILRKLRDSHIGRNSNSCPNRVNSDSRVLLRLVGDFTARYIENPPVPKTNEAFGRKGEISGLELPNIYSQTMI